MVAVTLTDRPSGRLRRRLTPALDLMTIIATNDKRWYPAYSALALYVLLCGLFVSLAPDSYFPHLPFSQSLAALSATPSCVAISIEAMWMTFPVVLFGFSRVAPVKLKDGANQSDISIIVIGFLFFSCAAFLILGYGIVAHADVASSTKVARLTRMAVQGKLGLFLALSAYFCACILIAWFAFVACPRSYFMLRNRHI